MSFPTNAPHSRGSRGPPQAHSGRRHRTILPGCLSAAVWRPFFWVVHRASLPGATLGRWMTSQPLAACITSGTTWPPTARGVAAGRFSTWRQWSREGRAPCLSRGSRRAVGAAVGPGRNRCGRRRPISRAAWDSGPRPGSKRGVSTLSEAVGRLTPLAHAVAHPRACVVFGARESQPAVPHFAVFAFDGIRKEVTESYGLACNQLIP